MVTRLLLNHSQICQAFSKVQTIAESRALWDDTLQIVAVPCWPWPRRPRARRTTCLLRWSPGWTSMGWHGPLRTSDPFGPLRTPSEPFGALRTPSDPGCMSFLISIISGMWWSLWRSKRCMGVGSVSKSQSVSAGQNRLNVCDSWVRKTRTLWITLRLTCYPSSRRFSQDFALFQVSHVFFAEIIFAEEIRANPSRFRPGLYEMASLRRPFEVSHGEQFFCNVQWLSASHGNM